MDGEEAEGAGAGDAWRSRTPPDWPTNFRENAPSKRLEAIGVRAADPPPQPSARPQGSQLTPAARLAASGYGKCSCRRCRLLPVVAADFAAELHSLDAARGGSTCGTMFLYGRGIVPTETTYSHARANFAAICDEAVSSTEAVIIHRRGAQDVALVSAAELRSLQETAHLLRSPKNAERLLAALKRARARSGTPQTPESLRREFGLAKEPSPRRRAR
jgi:antitoxin YefM